jgi:hypothetical protein
MIGLPLLLCTAAGSRFARPATVSRNPQPRPLTSAPVGTWEEAATVGSEEKGR